MRIIFLDIDGVLNNRLWIQELSRQPDPNPYLFDPKNVEALNHIIEMTEANIVISSAWRHGKKLNWLRKHLRKQGVKGHVLGVTPDGWNNLKSFPDNWVRGHEIELWLQKNTDGRAVFVILDDDDDMGPLMDKLVQTSMERGLTMAEAARAINILKGVTW